MSNELTQRGSNDLAVQQTQEQDAAIQIATTRAAQEVQAAMIVAKKCPRNETTAITRILQACTRKSLAEQACYSYPRGGQEITGPSIRLAEVLAQNWGNMDSGIVELEQRNGESSVLAYAWDLETNTRFSKVFQVPHKRETKKGSYALTDSRDIYELVANQGSRRLRACILAVIPRDVQDLAVEKCEETMKTGNTEPLIDRVRKMAVAFQEKFTVSTEMLEKRIGHKLDSTNETEMVSLRKIYVSLKDGMSTRDQWFGDSVPEKATISVDQLKPGTPDAPKTPAPGGATEAEQKKAEAVEAEQIAAKVAAKKAGKGKAKESTPAAEPDEPGAHDGDLEL